MKKCLCICASLIAIISCSKKDIKQHDVKLKDNVSTVNISADSIDFDNLDITPKSDNTFESTISRLRGSSFIKKSSLKSNKANVIFYKDFDEYIKDRPKSNLEDSDFITYFDSEKTVLKTIISAAGKILEKEPSVDIVDVEKLYNGKKYHISVSRKVLEINNIDIMNKFSDNYIYNDNGREKFYKTFKK
ncbi:hypothetical protein [Chryseobacterium sp. 5_R23647]|uniref:hypothetical protein n=1 Tax=Chryseobacterium sp. 5_R23647 TaxID=2258964 RepID=UPI000E37386F|nr:hypothetical protein [Chryseobacterium sp. 5_R23647]REC41778.1 hypothetical protein DRF69_13670 [Chryseobacterium sp. 5_R23647]